MANHKSAIKRHKQSEQRRQRNASAKSTLRSAIKKVTEAAGAGKTEEAQSTLKAAIKVITKAASKKVIHKNNAARKVSRLTKLASGAK